MITAIAIYAAIFFAGYSAFLASIANRRREQVRELRHTIRALKDANRGLASHARTVEDTARVLDLDARRRVSEAAHRADVLTIANLAVGAITLHRTAQGSRVNVGDGHGDLDWLAATHGTDPEIMALLPLLRLRAAVWGQP